MAPKPPRRPGTQGDRDERVTKAPPPGLIERATADQSLEQRADAVAAAACGVVGEVIHEETTNPHATDFEKMQHRAERAARNSKLAADNSLGILTSVVAVRERVAKIEGQLGIVLVQFKAQLEMQRQVHTNVINAKTNVDTAEALADIDDTKEAKKFKRQLLDKWMTPIVSTITAGLAVLVTSLLQKC